MNFRTVEAELQAQEYRRPERFNDDLDQAIIEFRNKLKDITADHSTIWRNQSVTLAEYETLRKAAREDIINTIGVMLANFK